MNAVELTDLTKHYGDFTLDRVSLSLPEGCVNCLTEAVWNALDRENRVSLWTRTVDLRSGEVRTRIVNANE